jgi:hypothetical protein
MGGGVDRASTLPFAKHCPKEKSPIKSILQVGLYIDRSRIVCSKFNLEH